MFRLWDLVLVSYFAMDPKNASSRGPLRAKKIHTKSTSLSVNKKAMQGIALTQPWAVEVDFVSYLPIRNQLLTLTWRTNECGGRKWGLVRANPVDKNRCIDALIVISYRFLSIGSSVEEFLAFRGALGGVLGAIFAFKTENFWKTLILPAFYPLFFGFLTPKEPSSHPKSLPKWS